MGGSLGVWRRKEGLPPQLLPVPLSVTPPPFFAPAAALPSFSSSEIHFCSFSNTQNQPHPSSPSRPVSLPLELPAASPAGLGSSPRRQYYDNCRLCSPRSRGGNCSLQFSIFAFLVTK